MRSITILHRVVSVDFLGKKISEQRFDLKMRVGVAHSRNSGEASMARLKEGRVNGARNLKYFALERRKLEVRKVWADTAFLCHSHI